MQTVIDGTLTHYQELNPAADKTLVILHGWANNSNNWLKIANDLPARFRYLLLDLPGFGQTQFLPGKPNIPEYTQFVVDFVKKLHLQKPILFGHSFGGQIALDLALRHPQLIDSLILLSPAGVRLKSRYTRLRLHIFKLLKFIRHLLPNSLYTYLLTQFGSEDYAKALGKHRDLLNQIVNYDLSTQIHSIKIPVHILWGSEDKVIPYMGKFLVEKIPNSDLHVLYGVGHIPNILHPHDLARELTDCLTTIDN